jgi:hypothetical protein
MSLSAKWMFSDATAYEDLARGAKSENVQRHWAKYDVVERYDFGLAGLLTRQTFTRCPLRRQVFYRRSHQQGLLPFDLSGAYGERKERSLLPDCGSGSGSGIPSLPALPP